MSRKKRYSDYQDNLYHEIIDNIYKKIIVEEEKIAMSYEETGDTMRAEVHWRIMNKFIYFKKSHWPY